MGLFLRNLSELKRLKYSLDNGSLLIELDVGEGVMRLKDLLGRFSVVLLIALMAGCGGGGGGGSSGGSGSGYTGYQISLSPESSSSQMLDPSTLFVGDSVQLQITARNSSGTLVKIPVSGWTTNAPVNIATVTSSGLLTAVGVTGSGSYYVKVNYGGKAYQVPIIITNSQNVITGLVRNVNEAGVESVTVLVFDSKKTLLAQTHTTRLGTFRISVPATAARFTIDMSQADPGNVYYYTQYYYIDNEYLDGVTCLAPLPSPLSTTTPTALPSDVVPDLRTGGTPPPPPTGCLGP